MKLSQELEKVFEIEFRVRSFQQFQYIFFLLETEGSSPELEWNYIDDSQL